MLKITVCIGSSCHLKGSRQVVEALQGLISARNLGDAVDLSGTFCLGACGDGVSVSVDGQVFRVKPEEVADFFDNEILSRL